MWQFVNDRTTGNESHIKLWVDTPLQSYHLRAVNKINLFRGQTKHTGFRALAFHQRLSLSVETMVHSVVKVRAARRCPHISLESRDVVCSTTLRHIMLESFRRSKVGVHVLIYKYIYLFKQDARDLSRTLHSPTKKQPASK